MIDMNMKGDIGKNKKPKWMALFWGFLQIKE
jgi:hypothetical protein